MKNTNNGEKISNFSSEISIMEVLLEIEDKKASEVLLALKTLKYTRIKTVKSKSKERILKGLKASIKEVNLAKEGKIKLKSFDEFLNEL